MLSDKQARCQKLLEAIHGLELPPVQIMEVCGTHTMAIAKSGIKSMLPEQVKLLSGPGCPVCVTPPQVIDAVLELSMEKEIIITSYGDMLRVPGSRQGDSLQRRRAMGADVRVVYSPMDAIDIARENPDKEIVFLGVGFETTAPGTAAALLSAAGEKLGNFSIWSMLKTVEPALKALMALPGFNVQGFLCPGHVGTIIGEKGFEFLPRDYSMPAVIGGFETEDILLAIYSLLRQIAEGRAAVENRYRRAVSPQGNILARRMMESCFEERSELWRGLELIENSGLGIKKSYKGFDAEHRYGVQYNVDCAATVCRCGQVITGRIGPCDCPLFGRACTPEDPVGPCMVSSEGACAAAYKYQVI